MISRSKLKYNQEGIEKIREVVDNATSFVFSYEYGQTNGQELSHTLNKELRLSITIFLDQGTES